MPSRTLRDELTNRLLIPKDRLAHGAYYKGRSRNATVARWNGTDQLFYHWRDKLGYIYVETIPHTEDDQRPFDIFNPVEELKDPKFGLPFDRDAEFAGSPADLEEHDADMWRRLKP